MPLFVMIAKDKPGMGEMRVAIRPVHLDHLKAMGQDLVVAGALMGPDGNPEGSMVVLEADTLETATTRFNTDPFIDAGLFASVEIKPWRLAFNNSGREF